MTYISINGSCKQTCRVFKQWMFIFWMVSVLSYKTNWIPRVSADSNLSAPLGVLYTKGPKAHSRLEIKNTRFEKLDSRFETWDSISKLTNRIKNLSAYHCDFIPLNKRYLYFTIHIFGFFFSSCFSQCWLRIAHLYWRVLAQNITVSSPHERWNITCIFGASEMALKK